MQCSLAVAYSRRSSFDAPPLPALRLAAWLGDRLALEHGGEEAVGVVLVRQQLDR